MQVALDLAWSSLSPKQQSQSSKMEVATRILKPKRESAAPHDSLCWHCCPPLALSRPPHMSAGSKADSPHITHLITSSSSAKEFIKWENSGVRLLSHWPAAIIFCCVGRNTYAAPQLSAF